ncbi:hypothetical protein OG900_37525 [Streptomyces sp. NBC_00433]
MVLKNLLQLVAPPTATNYAVDWRRVAHEYRHGFPRDYVEYADRYGEGVFDGFLNVFLPFSETYLNDPSSEVRGITADVRLSCLIARLTGEVAGVRSGVRDVYCEPDELVGWGLTVESDVLCWRMTDSDPDRWTTVVWRRQVPPPASWIELDFGMGELLSCWAGDDIPGFGVSQLGRPYRGSRFLRFGDERRMRAQGMDPWGPDPVG